MKTFISLITAALCASAFAQSPTTKPVCHHSNPVDCLLDSVDIPAGPAPTGCSKYELLIARGTSEFGPYGFLVGDPLAKNVKAAYPDSQAYAVNYPSNTGKDSLPVGAADIQRRLLQKSAQCPDMKFAFSGYSQGASVIRRAFQNTTITPAIEDKIVAVVLFGDPGLNGVNYDSKKGLDPGLEPFPKPVFDRLREFCNKGDPVCSAGTNFLAHVGYTNKNVATMAADFIVAAYKGTPLPPKQDGAF